MGLIKCPDCNSDVSSYAETCPHCGYPIKEYSEKIVFESEVKRLINKIIPFEYKCPEPRVRVCIKCGAPYQYDTNPSYKYHNQPNCDCGIGKYHFPSIDVDYPRAQLYECDTELYIYEDCVLAHNIGDIDSPEFQEMLEDLRSNIKKIENRHSITIKKQCPDEYFYGKEFFTSKEEHDYIVKKAPYSWHNSHSNQLISNTIEPKLSTPSPLKCPRCGSTSISTGARGFSWITGFLGSSKTVNRCGNCGHKWEPRKI